MIPMDWIWGLIGGLMIGTAAAIYLLMAGRIMGASGILGGLVDGSGRATWSERMAFVVGLIAVPSLWALVAGAPETHITTNTALLILGGFAVGLGTRIANGCTSGHGVCGISRLSARGLIATAIYLGAGWASMAIARHVLGVV